MLLRSMPKRYLAYILYYNLSGILRLGVLRAYRFGVRRIDVYELCVALESCAVQAYLSSEQEESWIVNIHTSLRGGVAKGSGICKGI